jgi:hypothetical protein
LIVRAFSGRAAKTKTLPRAPKLTTFALRNVAALAARYQKSASAAAAPHERRVFTAGEGVSFKATNPLSDQAT